MTTIEVMRKALEALEQPNAGLVPHDGEWRSRQSLAIDALRADIARLEAAEPVALGAPIAPEHDAELAAHAERAEQLHAEFLIAQKTYAYNTPGIARCARMSATPEGRRSLDAGRVSIGLEPIWEPAFAATPPAAISWDAAMPTEVAQWLSAHPPTFIKPVAPQCSLASTMGKALNISPSGSSIAVGG